MEQKKEITVVLQPIQKGGVIDFEIKSRTRYKTVRSLIFQPNFQWFQSLLTQRAKTRDWIDPISEIRAALE